MLVRVRGSYLEVCCGARVVVPRGQWSGRNAIVGQRGLWERGGWTSRGADCICW